jgi:hypothetical protein
MRIILMARCNLFWFFHVVTKLRRLSLLKSNLLLCVRLLVVGLKQAVNRGKRMGSLATLPAIRARIRREELLDITTIVCQKTLSYNMTKFNAIYSNTVAAINNNHSQHAAIQAPVWIRAAPLMPPPSQADRQSRKLARGQHTSAQRS